MAEPRDRDVNNHESRSERNGESRRDRDQNKDHDKDRRRAEAQKRVVAKAKAQARAKAEARSRANAVANAKANTDLSLGNMDNSMGYKPVKNELIDKKVKDYDMPETRIASDRLKNRFNTTSSDLHLGYTALTNPSKRVMDRVPYQDPWTVTDYQEPMGLAPVIQGGDRERTDNDRVSKTDNLTGLDVAKKITENQDWSDTSRAYLLNKKRKNGGLFGLNEAKSDKGLGSVSNNGLRGLFSKGR